jgi:hypothetical protein
MDRLPKADAADDDDDGANDLYRQPRQSSTPLAANDDGAAAATSQKNKNSNPRPPKPAAFPASIHQLFHRVVPGQRNPEPFLVPVYRLTEDEQKQLPGPVDLRPEKMAVNEIDAALDPKLVTEIAASPVASPSLIVSYGNPANRGLAQHMISKKK